MAKRKAEDKLIVVKHKPGIKRQRRLVFLCGIVFVGSISFWLGEQHIAHQYDKAISELTELSMKYTSLQKYNDSVRQKVANLESGQAIDKLAKQGIQNTINTYKTTISQLQKDVSFYQNIMAPSDNVKGLQVQRVDIQESSGENRYSYKIVLAQVADNKRFVKGVLAVNLIGMRGGNKEIVPLRDVSEQQDELGIKFKFKYFQDITGDLIMPKDFVPDSIHVVAQSVGKKASRIEQSFEWQKLLKQKS